MVRRHAKAAFMAGAHVFPGGAVDPGDHAVASDDLLLAFRVAAIRELFEEAGILLARHADGLFVSFAEPQTLARFAGYRHDVHAGTLAFADLLAREELQLAIDVVVPCAHWVTPPVDVRRFDTRFFVAPLPASQEPAHDTRETTDSVWMTPAAAIAASDEGSISLPIPTWVTLRELQGCASVTDAMAWARTRQTPRREPRIFDQDGMRMAVVPGDPTFPAPIEPVLGETRFVLKEGRWLAIR